MIALSQKTGTNHYGDSVTSDDGSQMGHTMVVVSQKTRANYYGGSGTVQIGTKLPR